MSRHASEDCKELGHFPDLKNVTHGHDGRLHVRCSHCGAHGELSGNVQWSADEDRIPCAPRGCLDPTYCPPKRNPFSEHEEGKTALETLERLLKEKEQDKKT